MTWDVTVTDTLAQSYLPATSGLSGAATEAVAERKTAMYGQQSYTFISVAVETLGPINNAGLEFPSDLGSAFLKCQDPLFLRWENIVLFLCVAMDSSSFCVMLVN